MTVKTWAEDEPATNRWAERLACRLGHALVETQGSRSIEEGRLSCLGHSAVDADRRKPCFTSMKVRCPDCSTLVAPDREDFFPARAGV